MSKKIGVLALQGAFAEHIQMLKKLGAHAVEIRQPADFTTDIDGLILPGGESTVMSRLLRDNKLYNSMKSYIEQGMPVLGTCAGMILLAKELDAESTAEIVAQAADGPTAEKVTHTAAEPSARTMPEAVIGLAVMDICVKRNAYGRQLASFQTTGFCKEIGTIPMVFIRAPYVSAIQSERCQILSQVNSHIVAVQQDNMLATAFHPELTKDPRLHEYFLSMLS